MSMLRKIKKIIKPKITTDGAGVTLKRSIATKELDYLDPFLLFDHFGSENPDEYIAGFPMHPHRGIETVTYMLEGIIKHRDSGGNEGVLHKGDIQWMTAGSGIMHEEMPQIKEGKMEGFQLWINLPAKSKMIQPRYQEIKNEEIPVLKKANGVKINVIAGEIEGIKGSIKNIETDPTYLDISIPKNFIFEHEIKKNHSVFAYIFEGEIELKSASDNGYSLIDSPSLIVFEDGDFIKVRSKQNGARFLLVSGKPLNEPVVRYGPFVMNTNEEIQEALKDLQNGTFVKSFE